MIILEFLGIASLSSAVSLLVINYWIKARIENSIRHEYDKKLEEIRYEIRKREQAAIIAELFSKWIFLRDESKRELNRLSFEMSLWLPDDVAIEINKRLKNLDVSKSVQDLIIECRKIIQRNETKLTPNDITFFGIK